MSAAIIDSYPRISPSSSPGFIQLEEGVLDTGLLLGERLDLVPSFYTYATKACLMPIRKVQHELINLYFQFIHPMFPVVDEKHFMELHRRYRGKEELMNPTDFLVYQAVIAAGFGVSLMSRYLISHSDSVTSISVRHSCNGPRIDLCMKAKKLSLI